MIKLLIFLAFVIVAVIGVRQSDKLFRYNNKYGLMALIGIIGALITGIVTFFSEFGWWSFLIIAGIYAFFRFYRLRIFG